MVIYHCKYFWLYKKNIYGTLAYMLLIVLLRFCFVPEKFIYGHSYEMEFLEFLVAAVAIPICIAFLYWIRTSKKDLSIGLGVLFVFSGFLGLFASTMLEKAKIAYQLDPMPLLLSSKIKWRSLPRKTHWNIPLWLCSFICRVLLCCKKNAIKIIIFCNYEFQL